eukprot:tig00000262_g23061.t1
MSLPRPRSAARRALGILNESGSHINSDAEPDGHGRTAGARTGPRPPCRLYEAARLLRGIPAPPEFLEQGDLCACGGTASFTRASCSA